MTRTAFPFRVDDISALARSLRSQLPDSAERPGHLVVVVDHSGADLEFHQGQAGGGSVVTTTVEGGSFPVHKAGRADTPGYGDPQQHTEESRTKNIRTVADRVTAPTLRR